MEGTTAPAAPAATGATPSAPTPNPTTPAAAKGPAAPAPRTQPTPEPHLAKRGPDGKFIPNADAPAVPPPGETAAEKRLRLKLKVNGQEQEREFTEAELVARLQKDEAAEERFKKARQAEQRAVRVLEAIRSNPEAAMRELGLDVDGMARARLAAMAREQMMSSEERERATLEQRASRAEAALKQREEADTQARQRSEADAAFQQAEALIKPALAQAGLPVSSESIRAVALIGAQLEEMGLDVTPEVLAAEVLREEEGRAERYLTALAPERRAPVLTRLAQGMAPDALAAALGKEAVRALLQHEVQRARQGTGFQAPAPKQEAPVPAEERPRFLRPSEALRNLRNLG